ncbi:MAG: branched-chain amino acid transport system substrate-binding protein [Frankiales bacterium]|jgi:branched-chain amino acid transport system substrate-binding protein|nr:branched-chain amino acid transport system substrate-binding protein [Frankiales bacterium]MDX6242393.1 branched-chain amino acid transport system substrate-binding protein [Frankiales bacterium]
MSGCNRLRYRSGVALLALTALSATACSSSSSGASGTPTTSAGASTGAAGSGAPAATGAPGSSGAAAPTGKPLVIGASVSLTGDFADSGKAVQNGYQLWASTVNAKGGLLGRKVVMKIVDDTSSPTQVVTNYQNLINKDKVDLVFGPFSSLLTVPASAVVKRYGYAFLESAGGGPQVFKAKLDNMFFVQPAPVVKSGDVFADWVLSLPAADRPKTAAYAELDDPFSAPIAESIRARFEAAGIKTVYKQVYPAETQDFSAIMAKVAAAKPDVLVSGTQSEDAYGQVKSLVQLKFSPKFMFMSNGANSPLEFPTKVGAQNTTDIMSAGDWFPGSTNPGSAEFTANYIKAHGGTADTIDNSTAEAYASGQLLEEVAAKTGKIDNATIISTLHKGTWPTLLGNLSWDAIGQPQGSFNLVQWQGGKLIPVFPASVAKATPAYPKPSWGG